MANDGLVEIPDGSYQLSESSKYHLVVSNGKAYIALSGPSKQISDLFPGSHVDPSGPPKPPRPPSKVLLFLKANGQKLLIGVLAAVVLVLAILHFHPGPITPPGPPQPPPRPPWIPPNPPEPPTPTPNPTARQSRSEDFPTAEPGPEPTYRKRVNR